MRAIEREVCGCDYGGNSWTPREHADELTRKLGLEVSTQLVDLGAGSGWPGLYMATTSGCHVSLVDLPEIGLRLARQRAFDDGLTDRVSTLVADAADLPFANASFDAISHSDLLCCLVRKQAVLAECRRIVRSEGVMAFTVISIASGLSASERARALANGPDFIEIEQGYELLVHHSGWTVDERINLTEEYRSSCERQLEADRARQDALAELLGTREAKERTEGWLNKRDAICDGLFTREMFVCRPSSRECQTG